MALLTVLIIVVLAFVVAIFISLDRSRSNDTQHTPPVQSSTDHYDRYARRDRNQSVYPEDPEARFPPALGIDRQYQNVHVNMNDRHPVLQYQFSHNQGIVPATVGDPIRIPDIAGPRNLYNDPSRVYDSLVIRPDARPYREIAPGPYPGGPIGVPVPAGALKSTSGSYPGFGIGSVDAYAPFPSVNTQFQKVGILTSSRGKNAILNLFMRPIAPNQNLWEYQVQDKNGFMIKLEQTRYLEDGDEIRHVIGKHEMGPWRVNMFTQNRYVWV